MWLKIDFFSHSAQEISFLILSSKVFCLTLTALSFESESFWRVLLSQ